MLGIYVHIPFCEKKCNYCDFASVPRRSLEGGFENRYVEAVKSEISSFSKRLSGGKIDTIFIGGGTPSLIPPNGIKSILSCIHDNFSVSSGCETSMEANPGTVDEHALNEYRSTGINRLSIGAQSLKNRNLEILGRIHNGEAVREICEKAKKAGFSSINLDFIFGIPGQTPKDWRNELKEIIRLDPPHISAYCLTPEEGTPLGDAINSGKTRQPDDEEMAQMMKDTGKILGDAGYEHYEISNYSKPGRRCRHNIKYWKMQQYIGAGSSSASYLNGWRFVNVNDPQKYAKIIESGGNPMESAERLSIERRMGEFMMMGLRMREGISMSGFREEFDTEITQVYKDIIDDLISSGMIGISGDNIFIQEDFIPLSNDILEKFIRID